MSITRPYQTKSLYHGVSYEQLLNIKKDFDKRAKKSAQTKLELTNKQKKIDEAILVGYAGMLFCAAIIGTAMLLALVAGTGFVPPVILLAAIGCIGMFAIFVQFSIIIHESLKNLAELRKLDAENSNLTKNVEAIDLQIKETSMPEKDMQYKEQSEINKEQKITTKEDAPVKTYQIISIVTVSIFAREQDDKSTPSETYKSENTL